MGGRSRPPILAIVRTAWGQKYPRGRPHDLFIAGPKGSRGRGNGYGPVRTRVSQRPLPESLGQLARFIIGLAPVDGREGAPAPAVSMGNTVFFSLSRPGSEGTAAKEGRGRPGGKVLPGCVFISL